MNDVKCPECGFNHNFKECPKFSKLKKLTSKGDYYAEKIGETKTSDYLGFCAAGIFLSRIGNDESIHKKTEKIIKNVNSSHKGSIFDGFAPLNTSSTYSGWLMEEKKKSETIKLAPIKDNSSPKASQIFNFNSKDNSSSTSSQIFNNKEKLSPIKKDNLLEKNSQLNGPSQEENLSSKNLLLNGLSKEENLSLKCLQIDNSSKEENKRKEDSSLLKVGGTKITEDTLCSLTENLTIKNPIKNLEFLVIKEERNGKMLFNFIGGKRDFLNETPLITASREFTEETGGLNFLNLCKQESYYWFSKSKYFMVFMEINNYTEEETDIIPDNLEWLRLEDCTEEFINEHFHFFSIEMVRSIKKFMENK